jgi:hypothetical protein
MLDESRMNGRRHSRLTFIAQRHVPFERLYNLYAKRAAVNPTASPPTPRCVATFLSGCVVTAWTNPPWSESDPNGLRRRFPSLA